MNRSSSALLFVGLAASAALAACGGAGGEAKPAKSAEPESAPREREPTTVAEAQELIARLNADLSASESAKKASEVDKDSMQPPAPGSGSTSGTTNVKPTTPGGTVREESTRNGPADSCSQSCRALSSMRRAVSALCRMTGDEDARCSDAKKTLEQSESRVARCHCSP